jgi:hypothetical protein
MRFPAYAVLRPGRIWLIALLACTALAAAVPVAQAALPPEFGVEGFIAANCSAGHEKCGQEGVEPFIKPKEPTKAEAEAEGYTQAAGHPPFGITYFTINTIGKYPEAAPTGIVTHVRTDVGPGVSTNPEAVEKCSFGEYGEEEPLLPGSRLYPESKCKAGSKIGVNKILIAVVVGVVADKPVFGDVPLEGTVYNLVQPAGLASDFGVALKIRKELTEAKLTKAFEEAGHPYKNPALEQELIEKQYYAHTQIEGHVEWAGNYHDYYEIEISPELPLISSRLILEGNIGTTGEGGFITNPSNCAGPGAATTSTVTLMSAEGQTASKKYEAPIGTEGCEPAAHFSPVPFEPGVSLTPETTQSDQPDGVTTELTVPHASGPEEIDSSQLETAIVTLPEGMTLNPSGAHGLEACTPAQARIHSLTPGVACPAGSKIGTVTLNVPDLPPGSLQGNLYLGGPESGPITSQPYTVYLDAESARYGISVRLKGSVALNETTGRVTATFEKNPEQPISDVILRFDGGPLAPIANPLACGPATTTTELLPYIGAFAAKSPFSSFVVDSNGSSGVCPYPATFAPTVSTSNQPATAGASTNFSFNVTRPSGQQYLAQLNTVLPAGLVARIPAVTLCTEAQVGEAVAGTGGCPASSRIGSVTVLAGAGPVPYLFNGSAYLTGPYNGAPYGLAIVVPAVAGPFSLGNVVAHATVKVEPYTGRVAVAGSVPTIYKGIPLRLQSLNIEVNRQNFMLNPTSCATLYTETTLGGITTEGSGLTLLSRPTPFTTEECAKLAFKPNLTAIAGGKPTRANGANIEVNISQGAGQANLAQVTTMLPKQLPVRQSTLTKACPQATFEAGAAPGACKSESKVGTATATTPVLPGKLTGSAYLVSHGNEAFPNLDLILQGDGVTVILVGHTKVTNSIITTSFESLPDVPVSSFSLYLPSAPNSLLAANGNLCTSNLVMPTTILAQNGVKITQSTKISVRNCPVQIVKHKTAGTTATMTVQAPAAGSISASGTDLKFNKRNLGKAERTTIKVSLTRVGREVLAKFRQLRIKVRVGFVPKKKGATSKAFATVTFRA